MALESDTRLTPPKLFEELQALYIAAGGAPFLLDVAASHENAKCDLYYTEGGLFQSVPGGIMGAGDGACRDGLTGHWRDHWYGNIPFSEAGKWVAKAWSEGQPGLMVVPNNRCEQPWHAELVEPHRDGRPSRNGKTRLVTHFLAKRRGFLDPQGRPIKGSPRFGLLALIWLAR